MNWLTYFIESGIYLTLFYLAYHALLRNYTHFTLNRIYLLTGLIFSVLLPFAPFSSRHEQAALSFTLPEVVAGTSTGISHSGFSLLTILTWVYLLGLCAFGTKFLFNAFRIYQLVVSGKADRSEAYIYVQTDEQVSVSSFFPFIFIPKSEKIHPQILEHEKVHLRQLHSLDLILLELMQIVFWFNPIILFYRRALKSTHEFLADSEANKSEKEIIEYSKIMLQHQMPEVDFGFTHHFYYSFTKKRINMLTKTKSSSWTRLSYIFLLPFITLLSVQISCNSQDEIFDDAEEVLIVAEVMPEFPGGQNAMMQFLYENITYPKEAKEAGAEGMVVVSFVVDKNGNIPADKISVKKELGHGLDEASVEVVKKMPKWTPGKHNGKNVNVQFNLPVRYKLEDDENEGNQ